MIMRVTRDYERPVIPASWFDWSLHKYYMPLAREVREAGDPDAARKAFQRALELEPERATALAQLAVLAAEQADAETAIALYDRAARADPEAYPGLLVRVLRFSVATRVSFGLVAGLNPPSSAPTLSLTILAV